MKTQNEFKKEGIVKPRIKNTRAKSTEYPAMRVEQYLESMRKKEYDKSIPLVYKNTESRHMHLGNEQV